MLKGSLAYIWKLPVAIFLIFCFPYLMTAQTTQPQTAELNILFPAGSVAIDMNYMGNAQRWEAFERAFRTNYGEKSKANLRLDIYSGASPEGVPSRNKWLAENRGRAVRHLIRQRLGNDINNIVIHNEGSRWEGLYDLVYASNEPWRAEVLSIIGEPAATNENQRDPRETKLRKLQGGKVWKDLESYLAQLRTGANAVLSYEGKTDTIVQRDTVVMVVHKYEPVISRDTIQYVPPFDAKAARRDSMVALQMQYPAWAIKTNVLFWAFGAPNVQVEIPLFHGNQWSLEAEWAFPWFTWGNNTHARQIMNLGAEMRYWLGDRKRLPMLHGFHVGGALGFGYYDWESKESNGYQGEYINIYANVGYQYRWTEHWSVDASIGFGLLASKYRHYYGSSVYPEDHPEDRDNHLIWHDNGNFLWPGICHASVTVSYMFNAWPFHFKPEKLHGK
jgi:hypothetical protein